jgi:hypothetical protein
MNKFVTELHVVPSALGQMEIYCDNNGAIAQAKERRSQPLVGKRLIVAWKNRY